jgi:DnaK suppressor protein
MNEIRERLEKEFRTATRRLRQMGGTVALDEFMEQIGDRSTAYADEVDEIQASERLEIGLATRALLVERVRKLAAALDRLNDDAYGICVECSEPIAPARLRVMPEVETCVRCQDRRERMKREFEPVEVEAGATEDY